MLTKVAVAAAVLFATTMPAWAADTTGTVKEWNATEKTLTLDNGEKDYFRGTTAVDNELTMPGKRVTIVFAVDAAQQNERVITSLMAAPAGAPVGGQVGAPAGAAPAVR